LLHHDAELPEHSVFCFSGKPASLASLAFALGYVVYKSVISSVYGTGFILLEYSIGRQEIE
jgi:hypothetical protein